MSYRQKAVRIHLLLESPARTFRAWRESMCLLFLFRWLRFMHLYYHFPHIIFVSTLPPKKSTPQLVLCGQCFLTTLLNQSTSLSAPQISASALSQVPSILLCNHRQFLVQSAALPFFVRFSPASAEISLVAIKLISPLRWIRVPGR